MLKILVILGIIVSITGCVGLVSTMETSRPTDTVRSEAAAPTNWKDRKNDISSAD